jgi:hypothetical protein
MAFLLYVFIVAVSLYVVGMIVLALAAILGSVRGEQEINRTRTASGRLLISVATVSRYSVESSQDGFISER